LKGEEAETSLPFKGTLLKIPCPSKGGCRNFAALQREDAENSLPFKGRVRVGMGYHSNLTK
jgi:hypothetical protein